MNRKFLLVFFVTLLFGELYAQNWQFNNGGVTQPGNRCFRLTSSTPNASGQIWNTTLESLNEDFEIYATVNLGNRNANGGKGISFMFQQGGLLAGVPNPGNMGFTGISSSVVVEIDTDQDPGDTDPPFDHAALMLNGAVNHGGPGNLDGPLALTPSMATVKDNQDHQLHIRWEANANRFRVWFDCNLVIDHTEDIVNTVFGSDPMVYWGFTGGCSASNYNEQRYCIDWVSTQGSALPDVTSCEGSPVPLDAGYGHTYQWSPSAGLSDSTLQIPIASPQTTTTYTVSVFDSCGNFRTDSYTHTVNDSNVAVLSGDTITCEGTPVPLYLDVRGEPPFLVEITDGTNFFNFQVDSNGNDINTGMPYMVTPTVNTTYTIALFAGNSTCPTGFRGSATVIVDILNNASTTINDATCKGRCNGSAQFSIPHAGANYTYIWPDFTGGTAKNNLCAGTYRVAVNNGAGCFDTLDLVVDEPDEITLQPLPDLIACENETLSVTANPSGGSGNYSYNWSTTEITQTINVASPNDRTYSVTVTDDNNCPPAVETFELEIRPLLTIQTSNDTGICIGEDITIGASATGGDGAYSYAWNDPGSSTTDSLTVSPLRNFQYVVSLDDGCGSRTQIDTINVQVDLIPVIDYSVTDPVCINTPAEFNFNDFDTAAVYDVFFSGGFSPEENAEEFFARSFDDTGCIDIIVNAENDYCFNSSVDTCGLIIREKPVAQFINSPDTASKISDFEVTFTNTTETDYSDVFWYLEGDLVSSEDEFEYPFEETGLYKMDLIVENVFGCADTAVGEIYVKAEPRRILVPNAFTPNEDNINDVFKPVINDRNIQNYKFQIFNRWGQLIFETQDLEEGWDGSVNNAEKEKAQGIYIWQLEFVDLEGKQRQRRGSVLLYK